MKPINLIRRTGVAIAANAASQKLARGFYDVYAKDLAVIQVSKAGTIPTATTGYTIPAGSVIPLEIDEDDFRIGTTAALVIHKVG